MSNDAATLGAESAHAATPGAESAHAATPSEPLETSPAPKFLPQVLRVTAPETAAAGLPCDQPDPACQACLKVHGRALYGVAARRPNRCRWPCSSSKSALKKSKSYSQCTRNGDPAHAHLCKQHWSIVQAALVVPSPAAAAAAASAGATTEPASPASTNAIAAC